MNILGYRTVENHTLSFELLVDDEPIGKVVGSSDTAIPYWLFKNGVALSPIARLGSGTEKRVVAVCACGAFGCSCIRCDVVQSWDGNIVFRDFTRNLFSSNSVFNLLMFSFSAVNYDFVVTDIFQKIQESKIIQQLEIRSAKMRKLKS